MNVDFVNPLIIDTKLYKWKRHQNTHVIHNKQKFLQITPSKAAADEVFLKIYKKDFDINARYYAIFASVLTHLSNSLGKLEKL